MKKIAGARDSLLSKAQVREIERECGVRFSPVWVKTSGDIDQKTSLRDREKSDFFTKELDRMLLEKKIDLAIHSAKDLPEKIPPGLKICYLSKGVDPSDSLVIHKEPFFRVGTSSKRREEAVLRLFPHCRIVDIRGTIEKRLSLDLDALVVAEAALIRLELIHLKRIPLPGPTAPLQGKIAVLCREDEDPLRRA